MATAVEIYREEIAAPRKSERVENNRNDLYILAEDPKDPDRGSRDGRKLRACPIR